MPNTSARRYYRKNIKASKCRGKMGIDCRPELGCFKARGVKRSFCRKVKNLSRSQTKRAIRKVNPCRSKGKTPEMPKSSSDYRRQATNFSPENNMECKESAEYKMQKLNDMYREFQMY
jgi:hypothetical protein